MTDSQNHINEELLSVYLDGELTEAERERVDRLLAEQPRYRRMLDELQALRESLQSLPGHELGADFQRGVMQRLDGLRVNRPDASEGQPKSARTNMLGDGNGSAEKGPDDAPVVILRPPSYWRNAAWAVAAVAAGILMLLVVPDYVTDAPTVVHRSVQEKTAQGVASDRLDSIEGDWIEQEESFGDEGAARAYSRGRKEPTDRSRERQLNRTRGAVAGGPATEESAKDFVPAPAADDRTAGERFSYQLEDLAEVAPRPNAPKLDANLPTPAQDEQPLESRPASRPYGLADSLESRGDKSSADSIANTIRDWDATYVVHVAVAQPQVGRKLIHRSLQRQQSFSAGEPDREINERVRRGLRESELDDMGARMGGNEIHQGRWPIPP